MDQLEDLRSNLITSILEETYKGLAIHLTKELRLTVAALLEGWRAEVKKASAIAYNRALDDVLRYGTLSPDQTQVIVKLKRAVANAEKQEGIDDTN